MSSLNISVDKILLLKEFRENVKDILEEHHDDKFLIRWLRARKFDLQKAELMLREDTKFRKKYNVDRVLDYPMIRKELLQHERTSFLGFDYEGRAVIMLNGGNSDAIGFFKSVTVMEEVWHVTWHMEYILYKLKESNERTGKSVDKVVAIIDLADFNVLEVMDKITLQRAMMDFKLIQDHYPETLYAMYIVNAPQIFQKVYNILKPVIDVVVQQKVQILSGGCGDEILRLIPKEIIPAYLGGTRCEPPGDPKCHDLLKWGAKVPPSAYVQDFFTIKAECPGVKQKIVREGSVFFEEISVTETNTLLRWDFETRNYNIKFGLFYRTGSKKVDEITPADDMVELLPIEATNSHMVLERGEYMCKRTGTYMLCFDNSSSLLRQKQLFYKISVKVIDGNIPEEVQDDFTPWSYS